MTAIPRTKNFRLLFLFTALLLYAGNFLIVNTYTKLTAGPIPEWPIGFDLLILVPLLYVLMTKPSAKKAIVVIFALASIGILVGSYIIPQEDKIAWLTLQKVRWIYIGVLALAQAALIASLVMDIRRNWQSGNLESAVSRSISSRVADKTVAGLLLADARVWLYAFIRDKSKFSYPRLSFFSAKHDSNASNQQAFLILIGAEIPIAHGLISLFNQTAAFVVTSLSLYGFVFLYAEYRATLLRPTTFEDDHLHIRHGVIGDLKVPYSMIASVERVSFRPRRERSSIRFVGTGTANVSIVLSNGCQLSTLFGSKKLDRIYIGVDDPSQFAVMISQRLGA